MNIVYKDFSPEKFYLANKIIFKWENNQINQNERFVLVDSWNDYQNGNYLEPDEKFGYSSINAFSKSILDMPFQISNLSFFDNKTSIAIHIHVFYEELLNEILSKINLIPFKYDLFISTTSVEKKN